MQYLQVGEVAQLGGDGAGQLVAPELQHFEVCEVAQLGGDRPAELVAGESQFQQAGEVAQLGGNRPAELVPRENQPLEVGQPAQFGRDRAAEAVVPEIQPPEVGEVAQFGGDRPAELVLPEIQHSEIRQPAQFSRDPAAELVVPEIQPPEVGEVAQLGGDSAAQPISGQVQARNPAASIGLDPEPVPQRHRGQPVGTVAPLRTAGRVVERLKHFPIRQLLSRRTDGPLPRRQVGAIAATVPGSPALPDKRIARQGAQDCRQQAHTHPVRSSPKSTLHGILNIGLVYRGTPQEHHQGCIQSPGTARVTAIWATEPAEAFLSQHFHVWS